MGSESNSNRQALLWEEFQSGGDGAYSEIYNYYFRMLYNYGSKFTSDKDIVKDTIHDLFVKLWEKRQDMSNVHSPKSYLLKAMRHKMLNALAKKKKIFYGQDSLSNAQYEFVLPYETLLISHQLSAEQNDVLLRALNLLTPRQKEVIYLRFYGDMSYEEISSLMSLNVDSCYNLISKALGLLKKHIVKDALFFLFLCL